MSIDVIFILFVLWSIHNRQLVKINLFHVNVKRFGKVMFVCMPIFITVLGEIDCALLKYRSNQIIFYFSLVQLF